MSTIFVALFAVLSISYTSVTNINVQMSRNHRDVNAALSAAESGLEYLHNLMNYYVVTYGVRTFEQQVTEDDAYRLFDDLHDFIQTELNGSPMLEGESVGNVVNFSEEGRTGQQIVKVHPKPGGQRLGIAVRHVLIMDESEGGLHLLRGVRDLEPAIAPFPDDRAAGDRLMKIAEPAREAMGLPVDCAGERLRHGGPLRHQSCCRDTRQPGPDPGCH